MHIDEIDQKIHEDIENIMRGMECEKGFKCYELGFNNLCHAKDIGMESFVECLESRTKECKWAVTSLSVSPPYICRKEFEVVNKKIIQTINLSIYFLKPSSRNG